MSEIEVNAKRRVLRHDVSILALETVEESRAFGEDGVGRAALADLCAICIVYWNSHAVSRKNSSHPR